MEYIDECVVKQLIGNAKILTDEARLKATTGLKIDSTGLECKVIYPAQVTDFDKIPLQVSIVTYSNCSCQNLFYCLQKCSNLSEMERSISR
jgi:hypothetical protein